MIEKRRVEKKTDLKTVVGGAAANAAEALTFQIEKHPLDKLYDVLCSGYDMRFNTMIGKPEYCPLGTTDFMPIEGRAVTTLKVFAMRKGFRNNNKEVSLESINDVTQSGFYLPEVHPLQDYLNKLKWDKKDRIGKVADCLSMSLEEELNWNGKTQKELFPILLKRWLINSCAIIFNKPGAGNGHVMLIIEGGQHKGKTTFINWFIPPQLKQQYHYAGHIIPSLSDTTSSNMLVERWLVHLDDQLKMLTGKEAESAKAFVTADNVPDRKRYGVSTENKPRTASFMASVNGRDIFTDDENRRYMVFCIDNNLDHACNQAELYKIDVNQVWAQAMHYLKNNEPYLYTSEEREIIKGKNRAFHKIVLEEEAIMACFEIAEPTDPDAKFHQATELMAICNRAMKINLTLGAFSNALKKLNYVPKQKRINGNDPRKLYAVKYINTTEMGGHKDEEEEFVAPEKNEKQLKMNI
jgi:predicted P-loop ATPase